MDARVHHVQGEAAVESRTDDDNGRTGVGPWAALERKRTQTDRDGTVQQNDLRKFLTEFAAERLALVQRHEEGARLVSHYDFNNTYQYVISREETHLSWLENALAETGASMPPPASALPVPPAPKKQRGRRVDAGAYREVLADDARQLKAFVDRWRGRLGDVTHARHRLMLNVVLGESLEHARLFDQAAGGFEDLLGRRTADAVRVGGVLPTRWLE